jgi:hypothetical protein
MLCDEEALYFAYLKQRAAAEAATALEGRAKSTPPAADAAGATAAPAASNDGMSESS